MISHLDRQDEAALRAFVADHADSPLDILTGAIRATCRRPGVWMDPATCKCRPATHLHDISLWGIGGQGFTPEEAARAWRRAAMAALEMAEAA